MHRNTEEKYLGEVSLVSALHRVDFSAILFYLGILLAMSALGSAGILHGAANFLTDKIGNLSLIIVFIGLFSSFVGNVPLIAAMQGMYDMALYPMDHYIWQFLAYCTGTGSNILIIGSAAGIAAMGMENINFFWYIRKISLLALIGYLAGTLVFFLENGLL